MSTAICAKTVLIERIVAVRTSVTPYSPPS